MDFFFSQHLYSATYTKVKTQSQIIPALYYRPFIVDTIGEQWLEWAQNDERV